jgi:D-3-phosphoglycerate dehydrogenase
MKILICDSIDPEGLEKLKEAGHEVIEKTQITYEELKREIEGFDAIVVRSRTKVTREIIEKGKKLKVIARAGVGLDNIDANAANEKGIKVISTPAAPTTSVAELAVGLMLAVLRKIPYADAAMKEGKWIKKELMGRTLGSLTIGVVGVGGRIGLEVARILKEGFKCKVIGYDIIDVTDKAEKIGFEATKSLDELLKNSDIVTIHVPYLPSTHHLINEEKINLMKNGSILINTSRGDIVDGKALLKALKSGKLAGAGLDVFHKEPPEEDWEKELINLKGVTVCTCHIGAQTIEAQKQASIIAATQLIEALK